MLFLDSAATDAHPRQFSCVLDQYFSRDSILCDISELNFERRTREKRAFSTPRCCRSTFPTAAILVAFERAALFLEYPAALVSVHSEFTQKIRAKKGSHRVSLLAQ